MPEGRRALGHPGMRGYSLDSQERGGRREVGWISERPVTLLVR